MGNVVKILACLFCVVFLAGTVSAGEISISADICLKEALNELSENFARITPGVTFKRNYGASGPLAKQIENVAPVDIYIPANQKWMNYLKDKNLLDSSSIRPFAYNSLVFAGPATTRVSGMKELVRLKKIVIGRPESVAAGDYALAALKSAGVYKRLDKQLILAGNSRECFMYAEGGKVDGAFVYRTDALRAKNSVILFVVPQKLYPRVVCPMALTATGAKNKEARAFFRYLQSGSARAVLRKNNFAPE